jgi:hypothetical protein
MEGLLNLVFVPRYVEKYVGFVGNASEKTPLEASQ